MGASGTHPQLCGRAQRVQAFFLSINPRAHHFCESLIDPQQPLSSEVLAFPPKRVVQPVDSFKETASHQAPQVPLVFCSSGHSLIVPPQMPSMFFPPPPQIPVLFSSPGRDMAAEVICTLSEPFAAEAGSGEGEEFRALSGPRDGHGEAWICGEIEIHLPGDIAEYSYLLGV